MHASASILAAVAMTVPSNLAALSRAHLVREIAPGPANSDPELLGVVGGRLLFFATDEVHGRELWRSDGTSAGTELVRDIWPGPANGIGYGGAVLVAGVLVFAASDGPGRAQLWRSDGTESGTVLVYDAASGLDRASLRNVTPDGSRLWFTTTLNFYDEDSDGTEDLWISDLTPKGTERVAARVGYWQKGFSGGAAAVSSLTPFRDGVLVARKDQFECCEYSSLRRYDVAGMTATVPLFQSEVFGHLGYLPTVMPFAAGEMAYFTTRDSYGSMCTLWRTDGHDAEVLDSGNQTCALIPLTVLDADLLLSRAGAGNELLRARPTDPGLTPIADLGTGYLDSFNSVATSAGFYFIVKRGDADELWRARTTAEPPVLVHRFPYREPYPQLQMNRPFDGQDVSFWIGDSESRNGVLWRSGGTEATTVPLGVMPPGAAGYGDVGSGSVVFLAGYDPDHGGELWAIDRGPVCAGDCDTDGTVKIEELVQALTVGLELARVNACPAADTDADLAVSVAEIVAGVNHALSGCGQPTPTPTPNECENQCSGPGERPCSSPICGDFPTAAGVCRTGGDNGCYCSPFECSYCDVRVVDVPETVNGLSVTVSGFSLFVDQIEVRGGTVPVFADFMPNPPLTNQRFSAVVPLRAGDNRLTVIGRRQSAPPPCYSRSGPFVVQAAP